MKKTRAAAIAAVFASALALALSCWMPPFDAALSTSVRFEKKLEKVLSIGPIDFKDSDNDNEYFVPTYYLPYPTDGYLVSRHKSGLTVRFVGEILGEYRIGPSFWSEPNNWGDLNAVKGLSPATAITMSPTMSRGVTIAGGGMVDSIGPTSALIGIGISPDASWVNQVEAINGVTFIAEMMPIGGCAFEEFAGAASRISQMLFSREEPSGAFRLFVYHNAPSQDHDGGYIQPGLGSCEEILYSIPRLRPGVFNIEYVEGSDTYQLVIGTRADDGGIIAMRFNSYHLGDPIVFPPVPLPFEEQVTDVLHDLTLVARSRISTSFYDLDGNRLFKLATGSIRFVHEYYDGARWYSYFSRTIAVEMRDGMRSYSFDVFRCPTSALPELAD